jgi:hypothetical protein
MSDTKKNERSIQEYLSIAYVFLLFLGIISDVIYYKFLAINIISYVGIFDILIAPINTLLQDLRFMQSSLLLLIFIYCFDTYLMPKLHNRFGTKKWYKTLKINQPGSSKNSATDRILLIYASCLVIYFLGLSIGRGSKIRTQLNAGELKIQHLVNFQDEKPSRVTIIGQNSNYLFYVLENEKKVSVSPILQNVKKIQAVD